MSPANHERPTGDPPTPSSRRNLPTAISVGLGLLAIVAATLLWWHWGFALLIAVALTAGVWEVAGALRVIGIGVDRWPILIGTPIMVLSAYALGFRYGWAAILASLTLMALFVLVRRVAGGVQGYVTDSAGGLFVIGYLPLLGSTWVLMLAEPEGAQRILSFMLCVAAADTGAYLFGSVFGRHHMVPAVSPGKTWEGFAGGVLTAVLMGMAMAVWVLHGSLWVGALLGLAMSVTAAGGDLVESAIKRDAGLKDMSHLLPGHGGAMDRLDSMLASAPVAWLLLYLLLP